MFRKSNQPVDAPEQPAAQDVTSDKETPNRPSIRRKRTRAILKGFVYTALIAILLVVLIFDRQRIETLKLTYKLNWGTPDQKDAVLDFFRAEHPRALVPSIINAILDDTMLPRRNDYSGGPVYLKAESAMCRFAQLIDGKSSYKRGREEYTFYHGIGRADPQRLRQVHANWKRWWAANKKARMAHLPTRPPRTGRVLLEEHMNRGRLYARMGYRKDAHDNYEKALEVALGWSPTSATRAYYLAILLLRLDREQEANAVIAKAQEQFPDEPMIQDLSNRWHEIRTEEKQR